MESCSARHWNPSWWRPRTTARSFLQARRIPPSSSHSLFVPGNKNLPDPGSNCVRPMPESSHIPSLPTISSTSITSPGPRTPDRPDAGPSVEPGAIGAQLLGFAQSWQQSTSDAWVLRTISQGLTLEFSKTPPSQFWQVPISQDPEKHRLKSQAIQHLLDILAIEPVLKVKRGKGVYWVFFLVLKKNRHPHTILDLKWLNKFTVKKNSKWRPGKRLWLP